MRLQLKSLFVLGIMFLLFTSFINDPSGKEKKVFPKPEKTKSLLFYVQRTFNTNTLMYELNTDDKGNINLTEPIKIHWVNYATNGSSEGLNYIQRKYAYGLDIKLTDAEKKSYVFNFVSYKKKQLYLMKSPTDNRYDVYIEINHKLVVLNSIFIQIEGGTFWVPKVKYLEVTGKDVTKGEDVVEKIIP